MYPGSLPFALPLLAISGLTAGMAIYSFRHRRQPGAVVFGWLTVSMTAWSLFYVLELTAPTLSGKMLATKLQYLGITSTPVLWFLFALKYTGHADWLTTNKRIALWIFPILTFGLILTNELHHLIYTDIGLDPQGYPTLTVFGYGFWFWINVAVSYILVLAGIILYWVAYFQAPRIFRRQMIIMVLGSIVPLTFNAIRLFTPIPLHGFDLTPFTFAISGALLSVGLFRFNLIDLIPIAAPLVIENLRDAVIVVDASRRIVDINLAARTWLDIGNDAVGRDVRQELTLLEPVWEKWHEGASSTLLTMGKGNQHRWLDVAISPVQEPNKNVLGSVIIVRDTTREQELLVEEHRHARQMEVLNAITLASLEVSTFREMLQTLADRMGELLQSDGTFITLWDELEQKTIPGAAYGDLRETYLTMNPDPKEITLTGSVLQAGHPLAVDDVFNTPHMSASIAARFPAQSMLALPLIAHGQKLGAALISFNQTHHFTGREIALGEQAAAQIALALNKNKLLEAVSRRATQLSLIQEVSRQMTESLDEGEICERTVQAIVKLFGYDEAAISLFIGNELELVAVGGTVDLGFSPGFRQNVGQGIMGYVAETQQSYFSSDIARDPYYYHPTSMGSGSALATPILYEGQLLGVAYVQSAPPNPIFIEDLPIMQTLSSHLAIVLQKARLYADVQSHLTSMTILQSVTETVNSSLELDNIFKIVVRLLKETYGYTYVSIYLLEGPILRFGAQVGYPEELVIHEIPIHSGVAGRTVCTRQTQFIPNVRNDPDFLMASYEVESEICVPLSKNDSVLGVLNVEAASDCPLSEKDVSLLISIASPVAMAIDNARLHAKVTSLALTDGMTGLFNRRAFDQFLETELGRAERYKHVLSLVIIDMDSFKEYNDTYGHPAGDERLKAIANILRENMRDPDVAARYGGEEFAVILPHTDKEGAISLAERLRKSAEEQAHDEHATQSYIPGYTISLGVATFPNDGTTVCALLKAADNAELAAKRLGKNRVCTAISLENPNNE